MIVNYNFGNDILTYLHHYKPCAWMTKKTCLCINDAMSVTQHMRHPLRPLGREGGVSQVLHKAESQHWYLCVRTWTQYDSVSRLP